MLDISRLLVNVYFYGSTKGLRWRCEPEVKYSIKCDNFPRFEQFRSYLLDIIRSEAAG